MAERPEPLHPGNLVFFGFHLAAVVMVILVGIPPWEAVALGVGLYWVRMFGITGGYHRYFSHRTYKTSRVFQFLLAFLGTLSLQKGVLWWAAHHRHHHRYSDMPEDIHSPIQQGFYWAHMGWIVSDKYTATRWDGIKDFAKYPELRALNSLFGYLGIFIGFCALVQFTLGFAYLTWGCFVSTVILYHCTFTINSLSHTWGKQVYATGDTSRNNPYLALLTMGEGWHNNHHYYQISCAQGFRWWQIDMTWYVLWTCEKLRLIWDVKRASPEVVAGNLGRRNWLIENQVPETPAPAAPEASEPEPEEVVVASS